MQEGQRVRLKPAAPLLVKHPELASGVGIVSSVLRTGSLSSGGETVKVHVRFAPPLNLVVLNAEAEQFDEVDRLDPRLRSV